MNRGDRRLRQNAIGDQSELRTPMAWQHRNNMNYQQQHQMNGERFGMVTELGHNGDHFHSPSVGGELYSEEIMTRIDSSAVSRNNQPRSSNHPLAHGRPSSPSTDISTSTSTGEHDNDSQYNQELRQPTLGSIHSTVTTWDGEPCPIHHMPMPIQMQVPMQMQMPMGYPQYPVMGYGILPPPPPGPMPTPAVLLPPMLRPRPLVMPADNPAPPEPLPVREPMLILPHKDGNSTLKKSIKKKCYCCKGHIIVLWIILSIIFIGVLLGVILRFVIA